MQNELKDIYTLCENLSADQIEADLDLKEAIIRRVDAAFYVGNRCEILTDCLREELGMKNAPELLDEDKIINFINKCCDSGNISMAQEMVLLLRDYTKSIVLAETPEEKMKLFTEFKQKLDNMFK